ncbi:hypothetical protein SLEP1_g46600 [Rubroshorea leprosula]|uniref:Uncharacterized protein n=1 Tax=Rubroshorea leprosula TaxID=152421 RepID=A0AAV5LPK3_9ROSI|nr:hypothetical protein SLEP1_g46600 [Rubroshorea leprosula]
MLCCSQGDRRRHKDGAEKSEGKKVSVFDSEEDLAVTLTKYIANLYDKVSKTRSSFTVDLWFSRHHRLHNKDSETWVFKHNE